MSNVPQYLLVIYQLGVTEGEPVRAGQIAAALDRSPSTTTEMLQRLDDQGLVVHEHYKGVRFTDEGHSQAAEFHDSYLVLRQFFSEVLDLDGPDADTMELVGAVSPLVTDRLASTVLAGESTAERQAHPTSRNRKSRHTYSWESYTRLCPTPTPQPRIEQ